MIKVIHYLGSLRFGGIEQLVYDLSQEQLTQGMEVVLLVAKKDGEFQSRFEALDVKIHFLELKSGFDFSASKRRLIKQLFRQENFVIHLHEFNPIVAKLALKSGKRIIYTEHGNFAFGRRITRKDKLLFFLRKRFFRNSQVLICCNSNFTRNYVETHFYRGPRLCTVHNGVSEHRLVDQNEVRKIRETYKDKWIIGSSSRLVAFKRIDRLIHVFTQLIKEEKDALLLIVGEGPERKKLESLVSSLNIAESVIFTGYQGEVQNYQAAFDCCVFPSQNEPFGLVALECLRLQKEVLVFSDGGGLTEIIEQDEPKNICKTEYELLHQLLEIRHSDPKNRNKKELLAYFSSSRMYREYLEKYQG
ncbi:MAG: glycosyltransferase [Bacteroidetes bacterium]|nr:MAG: glycosyltransferase [Bacteroidota bacterium]